MEASAEVLSACPWWVIGVAFALTVGFAIVEHGRKGIYDLLYFVLAILGVVIVMLAAYRKANQQVTFHTARDIESIRAMSWREFETLVGEAYRRRGYVVREVGGDGADGGIDLILRKGASTILVQCKQWRTRRVGVEPVRQLYGVMNKRKAQGAIFVASGTYTPSAAEFASDIPLELINGTQLAKLIEEVRAQGEPVGPAPPGSAIKAEGFALESSASTEAMNTSSAPLCPSCAEPMVLRTARRGEHTGKQFWGCSKYPSCSGKRPLSWLSAEALSPCRVSSPMKRPI